ncbi:MAG: GAP family protein [Patescibacteria group bacterium]|nr:GAP family protein [Patescibacteria group bacterium]
MEHFIALLFPNAVAVALSPMPIAALILILLSSKAKANSISFLLGWFLGIIVNVTIFSTIYSQIGSGSKNTTAVIVDGILGVFLLYLAIREWKSRPKTGESPKTPKWMQAIESISPLNSFLIAFLLITINSKNTVLDISTGVIISRSSASLTETIIAIVIYSIIASLTIIVPVFAFILFGKRLEKKLKDAKTWFIYNSSAILFVLFLILGVSLLSKAIGSQI